MKIRELLKSGIEELNKNEIEESILKAKMVLEYELGVKKEYIAIHMEEEVSEQTAENFKNHIKDLVNGKPIQYITNSQEFYGLNFYVNENVLIPQPDTEILVEEVINIAKKMEKKPRILDVCTGSGAIAISVSKNVEAEIVASDISENALQIAQKNAVNNEAKIEFLKSDMFENIKGKFDIIVSNPPYIETEIIKTLSEEVQKEPQLALDGGRDGLDFYRILAEKSKEFLQKNGILAVEIGYNQKDEVTKIFEDNGFSDIYSKKDFGNNNRIVVGKWR